MKIPQIKSGFGLLDVKSGRAALSKYFDERKPRKSGWGTVPKNKPIKVLIEAEIVDQWGNDDGVSIEFELKVKNVKVKK